MWHRHMVQGGCADGGLELQMLNGHPHHVRWNGRLERHDLPAAQSLPLAPPPSKYHVWQGCSVFAANSTGRRPISVLQQGFVRRTDCLPLREGFIFVCSFCFTSNIYQFRMLKKYFLIHNKPHAISLDCWKIFSYAHLFLGTSFNFEVHQFSKIHHEVLGGWIQELLALGKKCR